MKKATLILLLTIPFIVFGQRWKDSKVSWKDNAIKEYHWTLEEAEKKTVYNDSTQTVYLESNMELLDGLIYVYHDNDSAANSVAMKVFVVKGKICCLALRILSAESFVSMSKFVLSIFVSLSFFLLNKAITFFTIKKGKNKIFIIPLIFKFKLKIKNTIVNIKSE